MNYNWDSLDVKAYNNRSGHYKLKKQFNFIVKHLDGNNISILDVAGGSGRFAIPLLKFTRDITVIDINRSAINILKSRNQQISTICGDFLLTNFDVKYSAIICIEAMGYFSDIKAVLLKMNSLLSENGNLIFTYTNNASWRYILRNIKNVNGKATSYYDVNIIELKKILADCQFKIESVEGMNWIPFPLNSNSKMINLFAYVEEKLNLNKWYSQSPWLLLSVRKIKSI